MNKTFRSHISFLLCAILTLSLLTSCREIEYAVVSEGNTSAGFTYTLYENGSAVITAGTPDSAGWLVIPSEIDGHKVSGIGENAFRENTDFCYLKIEGSGVNIGTNAFYACYALTAADISGASVIGNSAFYMCTNLTYVKGLENAVSIGATAFCSCLSLSCVSLGKKLTSIGDAAFQCCSALSGITLPSSLKSLGSGAFSECSSLAYAELSPLSAIPESCFTKCSSLSRIVFSDKLASIGALSFRSCSSIRTLTIPKSLKTVADSAFADCAAISTVNYTGSESKWDQTLIESGNDQLLSIRPYCNYSETAAKNRSFIVMSDRGTASGSYSFSGYTYGLYEDGSAQITAYDGAAAILSIPDSLDGHTVVSIGEAVFSEKSTLSSVSLPDSLEEIGTAAFYYCTALSSVTGGSNLKHVGNAAFTGSLWLENSKGSYVTVGPVLVAYKGTDSAVIIPDSIGYIGDGVFSTNSEITFCDLGPNVICIGEQAFAYCEKLTSVTGSGVEHISANAFVACEALSCVNLNSPKTVGSYAFGDCNGLRYVSFGDKLETLSRNAFYSCFNLRVIYIPETVETLSADCFSDCICFVVLYAGTRDRYMSVITGEGTLNLADMFLIPDWKQ